MGTVADILSQKSEKHLQSIPPDSTVLAATQKMNLHSIGALLRPLGVHTNEIIETVFAAGERMLVFTHFASWGERLADYLTEQGDPRGEFIQVFTEPERVVSDRPVLLVRGNDRLQADTLDYQGCDVRVATLTGRVRATLVPR